MRDYIVEFTYLIVCVTFIFMPFGFIWYEHTEFVQTMVQNDIVSYQNNIPVWLELQGGDPAQVARHASDAAISIITVHGGGWQRDERHEYKKSLYAVVATRLHNPDDLDRTLQVVAEKYDAWINVNDYFVKNRIYAMRYTF
jgi:hypothetical protein